MSESKASGRWAVGFAQGPWKRAVFGVLGGVMGLLGGAMAVTMLGGAAPVSVDGLVASAASIAIGAWIWRYGRRGDPWVDVARDGVRLASTFDYASVTAGRLARFDAATGEVEVEGPDGQTVTRRRLALARLDEATRALIVARIAAALDTDAERRERRVPDAILGCATMAEVRARLGVGGDGSDPFRARRPMLELADARRLLDDVGASRAELLGAAVTLAAHGTPDDRARVERASRDCASPHFAALLRAVARREPDEGRFLDVRTGATALGRVARRLGDVASTVLGVWIAVSVAAPRAHLGAALAGVALAFALDALRRASVVHEALARKGIELRTHTVGRDFVAPLMLVGALRLGLHAWVPAMLVAPLLWLALRLPTLVPARREEPPAEAEGTRVEVADGAEGGARVRIEGEAPPEDAEVAEVPEAHDASAAQGATRRR